MTDNRTTELLPCPFCGGKAALRMSWMEDGHRYRAVECVECGATTPGNYSEVGDQSAWDWNTRTPEQVVIDEPDTIRNELADGGLTADVLAPVCVDEKERRAFERGRVHERFAQQIFKEATS